jgi:putative transposase
MQVLGYPTNGRFREECLNAHWFESIDDASEKIDAWRWDYNENRPHRSLKGLTPREFAVKQELLELQTLRTGGPI